MVTISNYSKSAAYQSRHSSSGRTGGQGASGNIYAEQRAREEIRRTTNVQQPTQTRADLPTRDGVTLIAPGTQPGIKLNEGLYTGGLRENIALGNVQANEQTLANMRRAESAEAQRKGLAYTPTTPQTTQAAQPTAMMSVQGQPAAVLPQQPTTSDLNRFGVNANISIPGGYVGFGGTQQSMMQSQMLSSTVGYQRMKVAEERKQELKKAVISGATFDVGYIVGKEGILKSEKYDVVDKTLLTGAAVSSGVLSYVGLKGVGAIAGATAKAIPTAVRIGSGSIAAARTTATVIKGAEYVGMGAGIYGVGKQIEAQPTTEGKIFTGIQAAIGFQAFGSGYGKGMKYAAEKLPTQKSSLAPIQFKEAIGKEAYMPKEFIPMGKQKISINQDYFNVPQTKTTIKGGTTTISPKIEEAFMPRSGNKPYVEVLGKMKVDGVPTQVKTSTFPSGEVKQTFRLNKLDYSIIRTPESPTMQITAIGKGKVFKFTRPDKEFTQNLASLVATKKGEITTSQKRQRVSESILKEERATTQFLKISGTSGKEKISGTGAFKVFEITRARSPTAEVTKRASILSKQERLKLEKTMPDIVGKQKTYLDFGTSTTKPFKETIELKDVVLAKQPKLSFDVTIGKDISVIKKDISSELIAKPSREVSFGGVKKTSKSLVTGELAVTFTPIKKESFKFKGIVGKKGSAFGFTEQIQEPRIKTEVSMERPTTKGAALKEFEFSTGLRGKPESRFTFASPIKTYTPTKTYSDIFNIQSSVFEVQPIASTSPISMPTTITLPVSIQQQKPAAIQTTTQLTQQITPTIGTIGFRGSAIVEPKTPKTPGLPFFSLQGIPDDFTPKKEGKARSRKRKYAPSVLGILSGQKISRKAAKSGLYSGFEMRLPVG